MGQDQKINKSMSFYNRDKRLLAPSLANALKPPHGISIDEAQQVALDTNIPNTSVTLPKRIKPTRCSTAIHARSKFKLPLSYQMLNERYKEGTNSMGLGNTSSFKYTVS